MTGPAGEVEWPAAGRRYEPVEAREARILQRARAALREEIAMAEEVLAVYLDLLGAVDEDPRLRWPAEEARVAFEACLVRLFDDLLATHYLTLRGLYLQANRLWQDYLETLWLALQFVHAPRAARQWLQGHRLDPLRARRVLEERGLVEPRGGELYELLDHRAHPRSKEGFERALTISSYMGEWQLSFFVGGEGNDAWLRRGVLDWLYLACYGLDEIDRLGVVPADTQWSQRRAAAVAAAERLLASRRAD
ncbi:MAG TPA: hypothetical protein VFB73_04925 [Chloroflexota bacterium]|nr:hypothetical protein [Chloroflexota bacterium]